MSSIESKIKKLHPELSDVQTRFIAKKVNQRLRSGKGAGGAFFSNLVNKVKSGVSSLASSAKEGVKKLASVAVDKGLDKLAEVTNKGCKDPNPAWEYKVKTNPTEKHQVFLTPSGCSFRARFSGPMTHAIENIKELVKMYGSVSAAFQEKNFASPVDVEAAAHDCRYLLSNGSKDAIRKADQKFIEVLSKMTTPNRLVPLAAMKAKVLAEDYKLTEVYGSEAENLSDSDKKLVEQVLSHLERKGYGMMLGEVKYGPSQPTVFNTGPIGYPKIWPRFPGDNPAYPPGYFNMGFFPTPDKGMNPEPRPNRPPKTHSYSVPIMTSNRVGNGQNDLYDFPTLEQQAAMPNPMGRYLPDGSFVSTDEYGRYIPSGVPFKDSHDYDANIPPKTEAYSVKIGDTSARKSYTGKGDQVDPVSAKLLTGNGRKPRNRRSAGGKTNPWIVHVKKVQKEKGLSYKDAITEAKKTYKK